MTQPERGACRTPGGRCTKAKHCCNRQCIKKERTCALPSERHARSAYFEDVDDDNDDDSDEDEEEDDDFYKGVADAAGQVEDEDNGREASTPSAKVHINADETIGVPAQWVVPAKYASSAGPFAAGFMSASLLAAIISAYYAGRMQRTNGAGKQHDGNDATDDGKDANLHARTTPSAGSIASNASNASKFLETDDESDAHVDVAGDSVAAAHHHLRVPKKRSNVALVIEQPGGPNLKTLRQRSRDNLLGRRWHTLT